MAKKAKQDTGERDPIVQHWLSELDASRKREKTYREEGKRIREIYLGRKSDLIPFNILYSNTEVIFPSLYSQVPRPVVQYRYKDGNPVATAAAKASQRALEFLLDTNQEGYESFHEVQKAVVLDGLLPGRGVSSVKYDAEVVDVPDDVPEAETDAETESVELADDEPPTTPVTKYETVCTESKSWDRVYFGYARKWSKVPWIAYEEHIDKAEGVRLFGEAIAAKIVFTKGEEDDEEGGRTKTDEQHTGERKTALIYQIWDRAGGRKVRYISPQYKEGYLKVEDDPLGLSGFFNCPKPLEFTEKTDDPVPTALYALYENQAKELNSLSVRISRIISAIKARGIYDAELGDDIGDLMESDDNALIASTKGSSLAAEKGLQNAIWFMPIDILITVLRELYAARENCKQVIYEIMGISDIVRGSTNANETLGAQQLKSQWGTLRIKPKQAEVQRYARDTLRLMLEIAANKFSEETWAKMTGLPYLTQLQFQQATQMLQAASAAAQQGDQAAAQAAQQAQQQLQQPQWKDVLGILQDDLQRAYKIDIETNSTVEPEAVEDQKNISDLMTAIGQFLSGVGPMVAEGVMPFEVAQSMLQAITRRFRFGTEIEEQIKQMKPPKPKDDGKAAAAQKAQQQAQQKAAQEKLQGQQRSMQDTAKIAQLQTDLNARDAQLQIMQKEAALAERERSLEIDQALFKLEKNAASESLKNTSAIENTKLDHKKQLTGLEAKNVKTEQSIGKAVDTKMTQAVAQMGQLVEKLTSIVGDSVAQSQELVKAVSAPRRRKAVRGSDGLISETIDEVLQ